MVHVICVSSHSQRRRERGSHLFNTTAAFLKFLCLSSSVKGSGNVACRKQELIDYCTGGNM
jgi:hypothetical protein